MSNQLVIGGTPSTPSIDGDWQAGVLAMSGDSYPENAYELFDQVTGWIRRFFAAESRPLALELQLLYLNTSSIKAMMEIFDLFEDAHREGRAVRVVWYYDSHNERVAELAAEFREDCTFEFEILARDEDPR
ncbi:biofilm regulation phosphoprotein SiaC [Paraburkholderia caballeronis]|uniref:biofilm regulation phosphoprotein SiaC n=1 Tax=Paraburkholderia caballeronis TaxID=416943 RepID=UPI00106704AD|nr:biofilm regulation phosphoprotein SiaC [Paraburkholderia caballeronis]TDV15824.1 uncharacterized protein DUF1987 [Paraburkholderia caballeronis]TDV18079.1 uncharacterized protein DUF1987 [Paraburkholderia caballeronis]TDV26307.1 uncharacterized protein DUF1987 [Paraburkholderia caballeronis]TDV26801.1 uncharacterized protein DUF1987 [Paraburkholderia caballeronis]